MDMRYGGSIDTDIVFFKSSYFCILGQTLKMLTFYYMDF